MNYTPLDRLRIKGAIFKNKLFARFFPKHLASLKYQAVMGEKLDWNNPQDLNAKIQWLKFYGDKSLWAELADKYAVRQYVEDRGCGSSLVKLYGKWDNVDDIDWDNLPNSFILKMNNGSGGNFICRDKSKINLSEVTTQFGKWMKEVYGNLSVEPHYSLIKPCIIAEELLDCTKQDVSSSSLIDYKVWCFNGKPYLFWVTYDRNPEGTSAKHAMFDLDWNYHPEKLVYTSNFTEPSILVPKPKCLDELIEVASKLSLGHPQVRVDLYVVDDKCYFGEMTFTSFGGLIQVYSKETLKELGAQTDLSLIKK